MTRTLRTTLILTTAALLSILIALPAEAGNGWFGLHLSNHGVGLSLGFGSWGVYGSSWNHGSVAVEYDVVLNGYGEWVSVSNLGRVWRPHVAADWRPYTHGRWVYTSYGWTWVSYEPWGYFPHHYGNWAYTTFGWVWSPGYTYVAANVTWVYSGGMVGWYPCGPAGWSHAHRGYHRGYNHGYNHGYNNGYGNGHSDGYWQGWHDARYANWVDWRHMTDDNVARHAVPGHRVVRDSNATTIRASRTAPTRSEVTRHGIRSIPTAQISQRRASVGGRTMTMVRPDGVERSVQRHADSTVRRALKPEAARRVRSDVEVAERRAPRTAPGVPQANSSSRTRPSNAQATPRGERSTDSRRFRSEPPSRRSAEQPKAPGSPQVSRQRVSTQTSTRRTTEARRMTTSSRPRSSSATSRGASRGSREQASAPRGTAIRTDRRRVGSDAASRKPADRVETTRRSSSRSQNAARQSTTSRSSRTKPAEPTKKSDEKKRQRRPQRR